LWHNGKRFYISGYTALTDIVEANYVIDQSERCGCTLFDLLTFREQKQAATSTINEVESNQDDQGNHVEPNRGVSWSGKTNHRNGRIWVSELILNSDEMNGAVQRPDEGQ
jgi:hypothetical protein